MRKRTSNNYTYNMGSHVMQFGALSIDEEPAADYLGELNTGGDLISLHIKRQTPVLQHCSRQSYGVPDNDQVCLGH